MIKQLLRSLGVLILVWSPPAFGAVSESENACTKFIKHYRIAETGAGGHELEHPGTYCLAKNIFVKWNRDWLLGRFQYSSESVVTISSDDIVLNLKGYTISGDGGLSAAVESTYDNNGAPIQHPPKNITVRNGKILIERQGTGIKVIGLGGMPRVDVAADMSDAWRNRDGSSHDKLRDKSDDDLATRSFERNAKKPQPKKPSDYPERRVLIEHMNIKIKSDKPAIMIQGAGTVIRNNVIEVDGGTAIWLGGPNALVENNTIIINGNKEPVTADAAIRLKHGDGAIFRNNKIIIKGKANRRAVSTFNSAGFVFENNTIYGLDKNEPLAKAFLGTLQMKATDNIISRSGTR